MDLSRMNAEQLEAIKHTEGPLLIMAGAGSGKTRVLTHRIAYLLEEKDVPPRNILAITFTNKAAKEMKERIDKLIDVNVNTLWVSTFHAMCVRILRSNIQYLGYDQSFSILDPTDQRTVIKEILKRRNIDVKQHNPRNVLAFISNQKNQLNKAKDLKDEVFHFPENLYLDVYEDYQNILYRNSALDFDDLIMLTIELFETNNEVLNYYQNQFQYIHVDEYQDTNHAQYKLIQLLSNKYKNICVVGDSDQSIYKFRGADITNILNFESDYPNAKVIKLEENYRSSKNILDAANAVIKNNSERKPKNLRTRREAEAKITSIVATSERDEGHEIIRYIEELEGKYEHKDMAILYRTNAQSRAVEDALVKSSIAYKVIGGMKFYDRMEIKDLMSYLKVIQNHNDDISFERIINVPKRGIGQKTVEKIKEYARIKDISMYEAILEVDFIGVPKSALNKLVLLSETLEALHQKSKYISVTELVDEVLHDTGYLEMLELEKTLESRSRIENLEEFKTVTREFDEDNEISDELLFNFLSDMALVTDQDGVSNDNAVTLMTMHASKGLEFKVVFIIGLEEGIFPSKRSMFDDNELEEERRLMYVAMTRAEDRLYVSRAETRTLYGRTEANINSRFFGEIPEELIEGEISNTNPFQHSTSSNFKQAPKKKSRILTNNSGVTFSVGDKVTHNKFGDGIISNIKGEGDSQELDIIFENTGPKRLLANFAPIKKKES